MECFGSIMGSFGIKTKMRIEYYGIAKGIYDMLRYLYGANQDILGNPEGKYGNQLDSYAIIKDKYGILHHIFEITKV